MIHNVAIHGFKKNPRAAIEIHDLVLPAALMSLHNKKSLASFGPTPFTVTCQKSYLRTRTNLQGKQTTNSENLLPEMNAPLQFTSSGETEEDNSDDNTESWTKDAESIVTLEDSDALSNSKDNLESLETGRSIFQDLEQNPTAPIRSRVLKDPWHAFDMINVPKAHGL